jgi:hypothetical protein
MSTASINTLGDMAKMAQASSTLALARREEAREFRLLYLLSFAIFLVAAVVARLLPWRERRPGQPSRSIVAEARAAANTFVPLAFMG